MAVIIATWKTPHALSNRCVGHESELKTSLTRSVAMFSNNKSSGKPLRNNCNVQCRDPVGSELWGQSNVQRILPLKCSCNTKSCWAYRISPIPRSLKACHNDCPTKPISPALPEEALPPLLLELLDLCCCLCCCWLILLCSSTTCCHSLMCDCPGFFGTSPSLGWKSFDNSSSNISGAVVVFKVSTTSSDIDW